MDSVLGRLRPALKTRKNNPSASSKEDILNTIEQFEKNDSESEAVPHTAKVSEDNNNLKHQTSCDSVVAKWDMLDYESPSASHSHSYSSEWDRLFTTPNYMVKLKDHGTGGRLRSSRFRSVVWKICLEVLPEDMDQWLGRCREWRLKYDDLKNQLIINPRKAVDLQADITLNNPLSQDDESPWNKFFQDNELRLTIKQDVIRTFPELEFFTSAEMQEMMVDVLFCYSRTHKDLSYKQGMHELLAPLIFVLHCDHQAFLHACEIETVHQIPLHYRDIVKEVMNPSFLEHDAYVMFCQVMETVEPWYMTKDFPFSKIMDFVVAQPFARPQDLNPSNVIVTKLTRIQDYILKKYDQELHQHLERLEIAPQIYGIRWIRLLFGREFPMQDLLVLWDSIFADGIGFDLVDYIFVSMLLYIRDLLLSSDYASCLGCLMKYPPVGDVHYFVEKALYLREPNQYPRPPNYTCQTVNKSQSSRARHSKASPVPDGKRGSTASLSQLEDAMFRHTPSSSSLARLEAANHRSTQSTPAAYSPAGFSTDEGSVQSSPTKYSTLPGRTKNKLGKKLTKTEQEMHQQVTYLQGQLNDKSAMCRYCASKLDIHIDRLQNELVKQHLETEDEIMLSLAGIKQVRDVLNGTLRFSQNLLDEDDIAINDNHYKEESSIVLPESDAITHDSARIMQNVGKRKHQKLFYMSSEDNSESAESPESFNGIVHPRDKELELDDYRKKRSSKGDIHGSGPQQVSESALSDSLSQSSGSGAAQTQSVSSDTFDVSPNPLYNYSLDDMDDQ